MSGRDRERVVAYWLELARADLLASRQLAKDPAIPPRIAAYLAQHAAEKVLKAGVARAGTEPPRTHDLVRLAHQTEGVLHLNVSDDDLRTLTDAHIQGQYPDPVAPAYQTEEVLSLLEIASDVMSEAQSTLER